MICTHLVFREFEGEEHPIFPLNPRDTRFLSVEKQGKQSNMAVNIPGVIAMVIFYLLVLGIGVWASFKSRRMQRKSAATEMNMALLGNRSINTLVGIFTMTGKEAAHSKLASQL